MTITFIVAWATMGGTIAAGLIEVATRDWRKKRAFLKACKAPWPS